LAGFEQHRKELDELGVKVVAASVDPIDKAKLVADEVSFPIGYGVTRAMADQLGSWWEERRSIIQPSEFLVAADGKVRAATYSSGPIGRVHPADVVRLVNFYDKQAAEKK
jgi:peroxiredoxin